MKTQRPTEICLWSQLLSHPYPALTLAPKLVVLNMDNIQIRSNSIVLNVHVYLVILALLPLIRRRLTLLFASKLVVLNISDTLIQ